MPHGGRCVEALMDASAFVIAVALVAIGAIIWDWYINLRGAK